MVFFYWNVYTNALHNDYKLILFFYRVDSDLRNSRVKIQKIELPLSEVPSSLIKQESLTEDIYNPNFFVVDDQISQEYDVDELLNNS